jgi:hypothetical protein
VLLSAGLLKLAHTQSSSDPWPTLGEMIDAGKRVVVFVREIDDGTAGESNGGAAVESDERLLPFEQWFWSTSEEVNTAADFDCSRDEGLASAPMMLVHHYLSYADQSDIDGGTDPIEQADGVNERTVLAGRLQSCEAQYARRVNIVLVDYYELGNVFDAVQTFNLSK